MSPAVAFVQRRVPHYREAFFAGLHEDLRQRGISLEVMVAGPQAQPAALSPTVPPWQSTIGARRLAAAGREVIWQNVVRATAAHDLVITELSPRIISNLALLARSRRGGPRVGGFGHGRNFASTRIPGPRSAHGRLVRSLDWWFAYNDLSREALLALGVAAARITPVNNTIDTKLLADAVASHRGADPVELRRSLGIEGAPVAIFCGSLFARKRLDFIFDSVLRLRHDFPDLNLLFVGDGPCEAQVRAFADVHDWVHYVGRVVGAQRAKYLAASDVMLMPGLVGLVVLDSFAAKVPLITTDWPFHSPEIQYLLHGENGWCAKNTLDAYVEAVALVLGDHELRARLRRGCEEATALYPMQGMVTRFAEGIVAALGPGGRRSA